MLKSNIKEYKFQGFGFYLILTVNGGLEIFGTTCSLKHKYSLWFKWFSTRCNGGIVWFERKNDDRDWRGMFDVKYSIVKFLFLIITVFDILKSSGWSISLKWILKCEEEISIEKKLIKLIIYVWNSSVIYLNMNRSFQQDIIPLMLL